MYGYSLLTDSELAALLRTGDERAFMEIYQRYWEKTYLKSFKRIHDTFEAEEIVQDIFCNLWRKHESLMLIKGFDSYFAGAVKFEVINRFAKQARRASLKNELRSTYEEEDNSTFELIDLKEMQAQLQDTIDQLPDKCGTVFRLKFEKEYSQQQIARELRISEKTVEAHLAKARKILRTKFGRTLGLLICFL